MSRPRPRPRSLALAAMLGCVLPLAACTAGQPSPVAGPTTPSSAAPAQPDASTDEPAELAPDTPLPWGPTAGELAQARELVAGWTPEQLAGQVMIGRYDGTDPSVPGQLVADLHLAGVCVTAANVVDADQVRATTDAVEQAVAGDGRDFPAVIGVDEEGGTVSHLRGVATDFPAFAAAGEAIGRHERSGREAVEKAAYATGLELRSLGFTWIFAPDADVTIGPADVTIGTRSPSGDPRLASLAAAAAVRGYDRSGVVSTAKHFPGHGSATVDSHTTLPLITSTLEQLRERDLLPFERAVDAGAPAVMVGHLDVEAIAPGGASSIEPAIYDFLRGEVGFEGVAVTDSLGMGAVLGTPDLMATALEAGADLLLMPADTRSAHARLTRAIADGEIDRARVEDAAARVVAVQRWQQRVAGETPVPADVSEKAEAASASLREAAFGS